MQRTPPAAGELPRKGNLLPDLWLADATGEPRPLSSWRGARTAVIVAAGSHAREFLDSLSAASAELRAENIAVIVIVLDRAANGDLIVLRDPGGSAHARLAGTTMNAWAAYVTDQYGEIYALFRHDSGDAVPSAKDLLEWAKFVNIRCEECFPPEWPDPA